MSCRVVPAYFAVNLSTSALETFSTRKFQLRHVDVMHLAWFFCTGGESDTLHSALGLHGPEVFSLWVKIRLHRPLYIYNINGMSDTDPLIPPGEHPDDDDNDGNTIQPFQPRDASTHGPSRESYPTLMRNKPPEYGNRTAETSFIAPGSEPVRTLYGLKIAGANDTLMQKYSEYGKDGKFLNLKFSKAKVLVIGPKGGKCPLFTEDEKIKLKLPKA